MDLDANRNPQDVEEAGETTALMASTGDVSDVATSEASSGVQAATDPFAEELDKPWPATFERSISLLASPIINADEAESFTRSPKAGSGLLSARKNQRIETPEGALLPPTRVGRDGDNFVFGMSKTHSLDLKSKPDALKVEGDYLSTNIVNVQKQQKKKAAEAAAYRKKIMQQQKKQQKPGDEEYSPGFIKEQKTTKKLQQLRKDKERKQVASREGKASFYQCVFNLANILMGVGLLGLPFACASAGWAGGIVALLVFSFVTWKTCILIGRELNGDPRPAKFFDDSPYKTPVQPGSIPEARMRRPIKSFPDIAREAFGTPGTIILSSALYFELFSCICIFIVAMADHLFTLFPSISTGTWMIAVTVASAIPMILLKTAKLLSYLSMVGTFATAAVVLSVFFAAVTEGDKTEEVAEKMGLDPETDGPFHSAWKPQGLPLAFGLVAYCFSGHAIVPSIYSSMETPWEFERVCDITYVIVTFACLLVGLSGYWLFGDLVLDQVTISLEQNSSAETAMTVLTYLMVLTAYSKTTLTMFPLALGFEEILAPHLSTDTAVEYASVAIKVVLMVLALGVSLFIPSFSFLCALVGMICTVAVSVIFPAAAHIKLFHSRLGYFDIALDVAIVIFGLAVGIVGTILGL